MGVPVRRATAAPSTPDSTGAVAGGALHRAALAVYELLWLPVIALWLAYRCIRPGIAVRDRLGFLARRPGNPRRALWLHAASIGECLSLAPVILALRGRFPGCWILVTTADARAHALAKDRLDADAVGLLPFDGGGCVARALRRVRPDVLAIVEDEVWPGLVRRAVARGTRVVFLNARIYPASERWLRPLRPLVAPILAAATSIWAQSEEERRRFVALGASPAKVRAMGTSKFDVAPGPAGDEVTGLLPPPGARPVLILASTHAGEEELLLPGIAEMRSAWPDLFLVVAPRDAARGARVAEILRRGGFAAPLRSRVARSARRGVAIGDALVLDTIGELAAATARADAIFLGGSLVPAGGHNPIEAGVHGRAVVTGPHTRNFADVVASFRDAGAIVEVGDAAAAIRELTRLLSDRASRAEIGRRAAGVVERHRGVADRQAEFLAGLLAG